MDKRNHSERYRIEAVDRALDVLETIQDGEETTLNASRKRRASAATPGTTRKTSPALSAQARRE